ncbi:MAG: metalloregulator ArsR/SmtB family transcription factor [Candidatus Methanofastidiosia archaeon]|jgi:ArsR family transcriptional regulator
MNPTTTILKALADETRLQILEFLKDGEKCVCEIVPYIGTSQSNVSQHLKILKNANIVTDRREGRSIYYSVVDERIFECLLLLEQITQDAMKRLLEVYH